MAKDEMIIFESLDKEKVKEQILEFRGIKVMINVRPAPLKGAWSFFGELSQQLGRNIHTI